MLLQFQPIITHPTPRKKGQQLLLYFFLLTQYFYVFENCYDICSWSLYKLNNFGCFNFPQMFQSLNPRSSLLPYPEFLPASTSFQTSSILLRIKTEQSCPSVEVSTVLIRQPHFFYLCIPVK